MKMLRPVLASLLTLLAVCISHAADSKPVNRVISIQEIVTDDPTAYATWVAKSNEVAKAKLGIDNYIRIYVSAYDGVKSNAVRAVIAAESFAALNKNAAALENDPALSETRDHLRAMRKVGARVLYQGVRFDGAVKNASVYSTTLNVTDEPGYLKALDQLRALFDKAGFADARINAYRVTAGRTDFSHRVSISVPNNDRLALLLDYISGDAAMNDWFASTAKLRTVVANTTSREITK
jgi:hypothetical protein